jgi:hypothetical protein
MIHPNKWWNRPLRCILGLHIMRIHPGHWWWQYCTRCGGERNLMP